MSYPCSPNPSIDALLPAQGRPIEIPESAVRRHRSRVEQLREGTRPRAPRFIKGPLPYDWFVATARLHTRALHVATALAFLVGIERRKDNLTLPYTLLREFGLDRHAARRALLEMEGAGLVTVVRGHGRSPVVSLVLTLDAALPLPTSEPP